MSQNTILVANAAALVMLLFKMGWDHYQNRELSDPLGVLSLQRRGASSVSSNSLADR